MMTSDQQISDKWPNTIEIDPVGIVIDQWLMKPVIPIQTPVIVDGGIPITVEVLLLVLTVLVKLTLKQYWPIVHWQWCWRLLVVVLLCLARWFWWPIVLQLQWPIDRLTVIDHWQLSDPDRWCRCCSQSPHHYGDYRPAHWWGIAVIVVPLVLTSGGDDWPIDYIGICCWRQLLLLTLVSDDQLTKLWPNDARQPSGQNRPLKGQLLIDQAIAMMWTDQWWHKLSQATEARPVTGRRKLWPSGQWCYWPMQLMPVMVQAMQWNWPIQWWSQWCQARLTQAGLTDTSKPNWQMEN